MRRGYFGTSILWWCVPACDCACTVAGEVFAWDLNSGKIKYSFPHLHRDCITAIDIIPRYGGRVHKMSCVHIEPMVHHLGT
jgi:hypothetical protein